jgi:hypothetical protein
LRRRWTNNWEEVDLITKGGNFGWNVMEGNHCFNPSSGCDISGKVLPIAEYSHSEGIAVIAAMSIRAARDSQSR